MNSFLLYSNNHNKIWDTNCIYYVQYLLLSFNEDNLFYCKLHTFPRGIKLREKPQSILMNLACLFLGCIFPDTRCYDAAHKTSFERQYCFACTMVGSLLSCFWHGWDVNCCFWWWWCWCGNVQGGSFDVPERMFHSIQTEWESASKDNMSDVRELIPEFFYLPDFLVNSNNFEFGETLILPFRLLAHIKMQYVRCMVKCEAQQRSIVTLKVLIQYHVP